MSEDKHDQPPMNLHPTDCPHGSVVEVKDWTADDACKGGIISDESGRLWSIQCVHFNGRVEVVATDTIKPEDRHHWKFFNPLGRPSGTD